jgi:hypothetical protein
MVKKAGQKQGEASLGEAWRAAAVLCVPMHMLDIIYFKAKMSTYKSEKNDAACKYLMFRNL